MPNPSTPETRGSTTNLPIIGTIQARFIRSSAGRIIMSPGGMLYAVRITVQHGDLEFRNAAIKFELTDVDERALYGDVFKPSFRDAPWNIEDFLLVPDAGPIPDVNAAYPYALTWKSESEFGIRSVTSYHRIP